MFSADATGGHFPSVVDSLHTEPTDMVGNYIYTKKLWIVHTVYVRFKLNQMSRGFTG